MSHFAKVSKGVVVSVIRCEPDIIGTIKDTSAGKWIQTSYNTRGGVHYNPQTGERSADQSKSLRFNYAGIGYTYDKDLDAFIPPQPFPSWTINETSCQWEAPVAMPSDGKMYSWDEDSGSWVEVTV